MSNVATVATAKPPTTARPNGAVCWPPSPRPSAIGIMPAIMARLVIRIARNRLRAPSTAASDALAPASRLRSAKVTSKMALATATPTAMIAPIKDWIFKLVPVAQSIRTTPAMTAGVVETTRNDNLSD